MITARQQTQKRGTGDRRDSGPPAVDVIIPCYNQGSFLATAIESALEQTYPHVGVIVIDDGSTDETPAVAAAYGERIRHYRQPNAGLGAARNRGLQAAAAEFVLFLDADDFLRRDTLERHIQAARARPTGTVFYGSCQFVDLAGRPTQPPCHPELGDDPFHALVGGNCFYCPNSLLIRREAFTTVGPFEVQMPTGAEDWEMWLRLAAARCEFVAVPEAVSLYRRYPGSMSGDFEQMWRSCRFVMQRSRSYHPNCALCREATARARRQMGEWCLSLLVRDLRASARSVQLGTALGRAARLGLWNPPLARRILKEVLRGLRSRSTRTQRRIEELC